MDAHLRADDGTVLRFANRLYERAEEPGGWEEALHEIADALEGAVLCVHRYQPGQRRGEAVQVLRGITPEQAREYREHHSAHNAWLGRVKGLPERADVLVGHEVCPKEDLVRDRFYHEFLAPKGLIDMVAVILEAGGHDLTSLNILRGDDAGLFAENEALLMRRLAPHICNVYRFECRFAEIHARRALLRDVIDRIPTAVLAVNVDLRIAIANRAAEALLAANDGLRSIRGVLEIYDCVARDNLRDAVGALASMQKGRGAAAGFSFPIGRPSLSTPYSATAMPIRALMPGTTARGSCSLLFIDDPEHQQAPHETRIQQLWGLTPAEAKVATLLASGLTPREISERLEVSCNTVRSQVQKIYLKTSTSRQADLVRLLTRFGVALAEG